MTCRIEEMCIGEAAHKFSMRRIDKLNRDYILSLTDCDYSPVCFVSMYVYQGVGVFNCIVLAPVGI